MEFASPVWNPWLRRDIDVLESVQEKFFRNISGLQAITYEKRLIELELLSLSDRRTYLPRSNRSVQNNKGICKSQLSGPICNNNMLMLSESRNRQSRFVCVSSRNILHTRNAQILDNMVSFEICIMNGKITIRRVQYRERKD